MQPKTSCLVLFYIVVPENDRPHSRPDDSNETCEHIERRKTFALSSQLSRWGIYGSGTSQLHHSNGTMFSQFAFIQQGTKWEEQGGVDSSLKLFSEAEFQIFEKSSLGQMTATNYVQSKDSLQK